MKGLSYSFLRAICALVIGLVLVMFPDQAGDYFVITIGVIFLVPSLVSIIGYFAQSTEMRSRFPYRGGGQPAVWLVADYHARFLCRPADICIGIYPGDGRSATDCLAFRCPSLDAGAGRFLCGSGIDSACRPGCAVQSYGSTLHGIYHYRHQQSGLCGFGTTELVQVYAPPPQSTGYKGLLFKRNQ